MSQADLLSLSIEQVQPVARPVRRRRRMRAARADSDGVFYYGSGKIDRFLSGEWKRRLESLRHELADAEEGTAAAVSVPADASRTRPNPRDIRVAIRGDANNPGEVAPRHLPSILCAGDPKPFTQGQRPAGTGGGDRDPRESADRARDGESHLAASLRPGHRADAQQFRRTGRAAHASGAAGLPGGAASSRTSGR